MLDHELAISIPGRALPKGSMVCVGRRGRVAHVVIEDDKGKHKEKWRAAIALAVKRKWPADQHAGKGQALGAEVTCTLERPGYHYGTGRNAGKVKQRYFDALPIGHGTGDVDKLLRLVLDAIQDTDVLPEDCAVIEATTRKFYVDPDGASTHPSFPDRLGYAGVLIRLYPIGD